MTREEAVAVLKAFMENPLFSEVHKAAFNIAIHDIKQRHDWDINKLMLVPKTEWEQESTTKNDLSSGLENASPFIDWNNCHTSEQLDSLATTKNDLVVDAISRVKAIEEADKLTLETGYDNEKVIEMLNDLPSVTPQDIDYKVQYERLSQKAEIVISQLRTDRDRLMSLSSVTPQKPTSKNDLGVDCISRIETIDYLCNHCPDNGECFKDCDEIKYLRNMPSVTPQEPRWIPVSERLPENRGFYLVSTTDCITIMEFINGWVSQNIGLCNWYVKAWMPLPKAYREVEE